MNTIRFTIASAVVAAMSIAAPAKAATFLDGAYGSKEGCTYAETGESSGADDFLLLNDEGLTTSVSACEFKGAPKKTATGFTIKAQCDVEGETGPEDTATLTKSAKGYTVSFPGGTKLGPMPKCR
ncbi:hypothetical protein J2T08_004769 [Neorhizobium galegae]|uniref:hypothetical protein n=1 Tax=Neorhizobium galegae TaxID=399 RepID=UPI002784E848|nr:hypothetical protein [Neorhizobium galegae]MDQ0136830.1 hypothetical protein [Neorhizobium galegae]